MLQRVITALLLALCLAQVAAAKDRVLGMSERVFKIIGEAQVFVDAEDYTAAREVVDDALERRRLSTYERAHMLNIKGAEHVKLKYPVFQENMYFTVEPGS